MTDFDGFVEKFKLTAWSERLGAHKTLAKYTVDGDGFVYIEPSPERESHFEMLGIKKSGGRFKLNYNYDPQTLVAKAFGLHADDPAIRLLLNSSDQGRPLTGSEVLQLALKGVPGQTGTFAADVPGLGVGVKHLEMDKLVDAASAASIDVDALHVTGSSTHQGMVRTDILVRDGNKVQHGYLLTAAPGTLATATDRLAIYKGTMDSLGKREGVVADKVLKVVTTPDGNVGLLCLDSSRPVIQGTPSKRYTKPGLDVQKADFSARLEMTPAAVMLQGQPDKHLKTYLGVQVAKGAGQNSVGQRLNEPVYCEGKLHVGYLAVTEDQSLVTYMHLAKGAAEQRGALVGRINNIFAEGRMDVAGAAEELKAGLLEVFNATKHCFKEIDAVLEASRQVALTVEEPKRAKVIEYEISP